MSETSSVNSTEYTEEDDLPLLKITKIKNNFISKMLSPNETITKSLMHNTLMIFATDSGSVYVTNPSKNLVVKAFKKLHKDYITSIHASNSFLISCCIEGIVNIISLKENKITRRYNFNRSLNYVKLHDLYDDLKNKCFFISSFNGLLVSCNLDTIENAPAQNSWLSYINFASSLSGNTDDLKIVELLSIDSILFVEIIAGNKMLIVDFNEILIIEFKKDGKIEFLLKKKYNIKNENIRIVHQSKDLLGLAINNDQKMLVINLETYDIVKEIELQMKAVTSMHSFDTLSYTWDKSLLFPPILVISSDMSISLVDVNNGVTTIEDDIELPISGEHKLITTLQTSEDNLAVVLKNEIFNVYPYTKKMVFDWYVENDDLMNSWLISKDMDEVSDSKRYKIGMDVIKDDINTAITVLDKNNYRDLKDTEDSFIELVSEIDDQKLEAVCAKLIGVDIEQYNIKYLFNSNTLFILLSRLLNLNHDLFYKFLKAFESYMNVDTLTNLNDMVKNEKEDMQLLKSQLMLSSKIIIPSSEVLNLYYRILDHHTDVDHYKDGMLKYLKLNTNLVKEVYNSDELITKLETGCSSHKEKVEYFKKLINIIINGVDNDVLLQYLLDNKNFKYFDTMLLTSLLTVLDNELVTLPIFEKCIDYYMFEKMYIIGEQKDTSTSLIQFLNKYFNSKYLFSNEDKKTVSTYFLTKWNTIEDKDIFLEEVIFVYIQLNEYNELLTLILDKKDIKECINLIMVNPRNVNNVLLWERIFKFVHTKEPDKIILDYQFIMEFVNKNNSMFSIDVLIFLCEELLTKVDNYDTKVNQSLKFKRLEVLKIKTLLKNELNNVYAKKMTYLQIAEYHE